jgi:hypothetical protein
VALLRHLRASGAASEHQLSTGFRRAYAALPDLTLDAPHARETLDAILAGAVAAHALPARWLSVLSKAGDSAAAGGAGGGGRGAGNGGAVVEPARPFHSDPSPAPLGL